MLLTTFQFALAVLLGLCALRTWLSLRRKGRVPWQALLAEMSTGDGRLLRIAHEPLFSEGLGCDAADLWHEIGGWSGWALLFGNTGALLAVLALFSGDEANIPPEFKEIALDLKNQMLEIRTSLLIAALSQLRTPTRQVASAALIAAVTGYIKVIAHLSLAMWDYCPESFSEYRSLMLSR